MTGNTAAFKIDNLRYDYTGNRLTKVTEEEIGKSEGYPYLASHNTIEYDNNLANGNGNMTKHLDKGISSIQYNFLNLPKQITQNAQVTNYVYRADGVKLKKLFGDIETNYLDGFQHKSTKPSEESSGGDFVVIDPNEVAVMKLRIIPTAEGYFDALSNQYIYNYKDHLGNVRLSYTDTNKDGFIQPRQYQTLICNNSPAGNLCYQGWKPGEIVETNNYYPFGLLHNYTTTTQNAYQYKYNGKELQETGMYDYGWRNYMPDIGRWGVVDPLTEKGHNFSPYNYAINNPIRFIDPDGLWISITDGQNRYRYSNRQAQQQVNGNWQVIDSSMTLSDTVNDIITGLKLIESGGEAGAGMISYYDNKNHDINIQSTTGENNYENGTAYINLSSKSNYPTSDGQVSDSPFYIKLGHEMAHGMDPMKKSDLFGPWVGGKTQNDKVSHSEIFASHIENKLRAENGLPLRVSYMVNPNNKIANGVDLQTMLIDSTGNSVYFNGYGQNLQNQLKPGDPYNAFMDYIGCGEPLKGRYNYYNNVKKQKK